MNDPSTSSTHSRLLYHGTTDEVRLGDRVEVPRLFGRSQRGVVTYIPDATANELAAAHRDPDEWIITLPDGVSYGTIYAPEQVQPRKGLRLLARGPVDLESLSPEQLEASERATPPSRWQGLGCLLFAIVAGVVISIAAVAWREFHH